MKLALYSVGAVALGSAAVRPAHSASYTFQDIVNPADPTFNQALGINGSGEIAGYYGSGAAGHPNKGYTTSSPYVSFTGQNFVGSAQTQVTGINNSGTTVGFWSDTNNTSQVNNNFGFVNVGGSFTNVNNPNTPATGTTTNQLLGVNNSNVAVGFYVDGSGVTHGYTYNIGLKTFSPVTDPNGATTATAINNSGVIAGFYIDSVAVTHGFIDQGGMFTTIDPTGSKSTMLLGLNDNGLAVGTYVDSMGVMHGLLFNLNTDTFQNIDDPLGIGTTTINGINDLDQLVGFYVNGDDNTIGLLANPASTTPLPAALPLFATGIGGLGLLGWRRKRKAQAAA
jgi:hypothetical protein